MSYITGIGTANPPHRFSQERIADFMLRMMKLSPDNMRKLKAIFKASGIEQRYSALDDYGRVESFPFFSRIADADQLPTTRDRLRVYQEQALDLSANAVDDLKQRANFQPSEITHLIVISCTGMYAPGLDIDLVKALGLRSTVQRTAINFMGCYAAFNGLKVADAFCKSDPAAKVLMVCTELCSLHFQAEDTEDNLLANALFADGAAAVLIESERSTSAMKLRIDSFHSELATTGAEDMAWKIGDQGFEMRLSAYVPDIIRKGIKELTNSLLNKIAKKMDDIKHFAIHPGGKKILEAIENELNISREKNAAAYHVLRNFGNMSSPTVLFVLKELVSRMTSEDKNTNILSFAFGPGLTLESMVLCVENPGHA